MNQPTMTELQKAYKEAVLFKQNWGARVDVAGYVPFSTLWELRRNKTTWCGNEENKLRFAIDSLFDDVKMFSLTGSR